MMPATRHHNHVGSGEIVRLWQPHGPRWQPLWQPLEAVSNEINTLWQPRAISQPYPIRSFPYFICGNIEVTPASVGLGGSRRLPQALRNHGVQ
jgi:hypothetical protein